MAGDHKCPVCQATFTRPQHVARHMRSHTGDRPYKCQHCGDQFARSDLLSRHINKCHASEKPPTTNAPNQRRKGATAACRATTSKQACDQCVTGTLPCDGSNPCSKCVQRKTRCTYVKFHRQTAPSGPGHMPPVRPPSELEPSPYQLPIGVRYGAGSELIYPGTDAAALALANATNSMPMYGSAGYPYNNGYSMQPQQQHQQQQHPQQHQQHQQPKNELDPLDLAAQYRQQAEILRRQGLLPAAQIAQQDPGYAIAAQYNQDYNVPRYAQSQSQPWITEENKHIQTLEAMAYNGHQYPRALHAPHAPHAPQHYQDQYHMSSNGHLRTGSLPEYEYRRHSLSGSDTTSTSAATTDSAASSNFQQHMDMSAAAHPRGGYAPVTESRPTTAGSGVSDVSPSMVHRNQAPVQPNAASNNHAHDGFSSAFGLMSLDDPNVLAGLATDAQPFFSSLNGALTTPTLARERERAGAGGVFPRTTSNTNADINANTGMATNNGANTTSAATNEHDRDAETRDLRDFWKQFMRTPLSAGAPLGATPTAGSSSAAFNANGGILGAGASAGSGVGAGGSAGSGVGAGGAAGTSRPAMGKRGLSRVASMPSVKTPALEFAGTSMYGQGTQQQQQQQTAAPMNRTYIASEDLRRYEEAVLNRKAPVQLNLVPKRTRTGSSMGSSTGDSFSPGHASTSLSPPNTTQIPDMLEQRPATSSGVPRTVQNQNQSQNTTLRSHMSPPNVTMASNVPNTSNLVTGYPAGVSRSRDYANTNANTADGSPSFMPPPPAPIPIQASSSMASVLPVDADPSRPSFKRLASQTLGPDNAKRTMTEQDLDEPEYDYEYDYEHGGTGAGANMVHNGADMYTYYARGGSESPTPDERRVIAGLPERYRRMSAPQPPPMAMRIPSAAEQFAYA